MLDTVGIDITHYMRVVISIIFLIWSVLAFGGGDKVKLDSRDLEKAARKYSKARAVKMKVKKTVVQVLLGRKTDYSGKLFLTKGKLRLEFERPTKSLVVVDGKYAWVVQYPDEDFGGPMQVTKTRAKEDKNSQILVDLLAGGAMLRHFQPKDVVVSGKIKEFTLEPKSEGLAFKRLKVKIHVKTLKFASISYVDNVDNETTFEFSEIRFNPKLNKKKLFTFSPPKDAEVTEI